MQTRLGSHSGRSTSRSQHSRDWHRPTLDYATIRLRTTEYKQGEKAMISRDGTTNEYQPEYLQGQVHAYQDAYADGELMIAWLGGIICWAGRWLVAWGQCLESRQHPSAWATSIRQNSISGRSLDVFTSDARQALDVRPVDWSTESTIIQR